MHLDLKQFALGAEKVAFEAAPLVVDGLTGSPILGNLVSLAFKSILAAQATGQTDTQKKAAVLATIEQAAPTVLAPVAAAAGADPQKVAAGVNALVDVLVGLLKNTGQMPAPPAPAAPVSSVPAPRGTSTAVPSGAITAVVSDRKADGSMTINVTLNVGP